jgi:hypothetical protein
MRITLTNQLFTIPAGQAFSGVAKHPQTLQITGGEVWITVEGSSEDYWLTAGDSLTLEPGRLVVMEAGKADSRIAMQFAAGNPSLRAIGRRFGDRLATMARRVHLARPVALPKTCNCS